MLTNSSIYAIAEPFDYVGNYLTNYVSYIPTLTPAPVIPCACSLSTPYETAFQQDDQETRLSNER